MKSLRNLSLIFALWLSGLSPAVAFGQSEALPANLGSTCPNRQPNANRIREGLRDQKVAGVCRQEVEKQYEACNLHAADDDTGAAVAAGPATIRNGAEAQRDKLRVAATRNTAKARLCTAARARVNEVCGQISTDLRRAMDDNSRAQRREISDLNAAQPPGPNRVRSEYEIIRRYGEVARELQDQRQALDRFRHMSETAIDDNARCYADIARRDTFHAERTEQVLASSNSEGAPVAAQQVMAVPGENPREPASTGGIVEGVRGQATSEATKAAVRTGAAAAFGGESLVARGASVVAAGASGLVGIGTAGLGILLLSTSPAGNACSEIHRTALSADASGCRVSAGRVTQSLSSGP